MNVKHINPFIEAVVSILEQHGLKGIKRGSVLKKESMSVDKDITSVIGINGGIRGNIAYSFSEETAMALLTAMKLILPAKPGAEVRSTIGGLTGMILHKASELLLETGVIIFASPPTIVSGQDIFFNISPVQTIAVNIETLYGVIEINIGLEE